jgi:polar amino acid transport system ATP-binding protein
VKASSGEWIDAPYIPGSFIINLGDAIEHNTGGLLRATPHRVSQRRNATEDRISFPFFFDPNFDSYLTSIYALLPEALKIEADRNREENARAKERWDKMDPAVFKGTYGEYLIRKVSKVFPMLANQQLAMEA